MTFDLSRRHWWNPTLEELSIEGERWASNQLELKLISAEEYVEFLLGAMPHYSVSSEMKQFPNPPGFKPGPMIGDSWDKPMRHWDD